MGAGQTGLRGQKQSYRYVKQKLVNRSTDDNPLEPYLSKSISSQDSKKNGNKYMIAVVGMKSGVGKSALIQSLINQKACVNGLEQTIGTDLKCMMVNQKKIQFWEFESGDRNVEEWENLINDSFSCIIMIFDEFSNKNYKDFEYRIKKLQQICKENKMNGRVPIHIIGNDRLDMKISGKQQEIQNAVNNLYDGNRIYVEIVDFTQIKELNNLLQQLIA